jgi:hypothetical protein
MIKDVRTLFKEMMQSHEETDHESTNYQFKGNDSRR